MRRHHFLTLQIPDAAPSSIGLLIGAEASSARQRTPRTSPGEDMQSRLPRHSIGGYANEADGMSSPEEDAARNKARSSSLAHLDSYARMMHAHTKGQLDSPSTDTIPRYSKTMHAHTLNQLDEHRRMSKSEASSPQPATRHAILPVHVCEESAKTTDGSLPQPPMNTPRQPARKVEPVLLGIDFGKLRRRSLTTPYAARDFAAVEAGDFAPAAIS